MIELYKGDCLIESDKIESGSVDLILTDLPYGTMTKLNYKEQIQYRGEDSFKWDIVVDTDKIMQIANRILRKNGKMILTAQDPFSTELKNKAIPNLPFNYGMMWEKDNYGHALLAKKAPLNYYEDVLMFSKINCYDALHPLRKVMYKYYEKYGKFEIINWFLEEGRYSSYASALIHAAYKFGSNKGLRFDLMNEKLYNFLSERIDFEETYGELKEIDSQFKQRFSSTFNLWEGKKFKSNILKYKKDYTGHHPTQKPVLLLEDLIKTFSNEGDSVVDLTMGSGSTGVACKNTNRNFIGIEQDEKYFDIATERINNG
tara:strand:+ start:96 stop:1040 length:945 start_codon:yes stop_codon:yes gene_type:complete